MPCSIIAMDTLSHIVLFGQPPPRTPTNLSTIYFYSFYTLYILNKNQNNNNTC